MKMTSSELDYEIERLKAEIAQEKQRKEIVEHSYLGLIPTVEELEKKYGGFDEECNEWKTRYETQMEMNQQLQKQVYVLQDRVDEAKRNLKDTKAPKSVRSFEPDAPITAYSLKELEKKHHSLENQLKDLEWKLDQESKAFHKANEERKQFATELKNCKQTQASLHNQQRAALNTYRDLHESPRTDRSSIGNSNIPQDQRILDPKRGPIRKTAAVSKLPKLNLQ
ncbi:DgyrCDS4014 [Dimorphilus gyrociliatus]|uniref:DgyrCDS4014 n=2 Tax=Dimorphilus gyrociliatus TaxID=2664684 RepID=A0A7I8VFC4_9ANNE|nr:DgyrCDS4014 [Dimorphilus gyrociliatus]